MIHPLSLQPPIYAMLLLPFKVDLANLFIQHLSPPLALIHPIPSLLPFCGLAALMNATMSMLSMVEAKLPPGFRFHPRDDELVCDYLAAKAAGGSTESGSMMMVDVDLNKCEPWDLPEFRGLYSCCPCLSEMNQNPEGELLSLLKPKIIACHLLCSHVAEEFITLVLSNLYHGVRLIADAKEAMECLPCLSLSPSNLRQIHLTSKSIGLFFSAKQYQDSDRFDDKLMKPVNRSVSTEVDCFRGSAAACVGSNEWYLFSLRDLKYATGQRTNRATMSGYWKATGKDKPVTRKGLLVGMRKTLVFYQGRAPKGKKTKWVMHEFRMEGSDGAPKLPFKTGPYVESSATTEGSPPCQAWRQAMKTRVHSPSQL